MLEVEFETDCNNFLAEQINSLTDDKLTILPSQWAEEKRYLPPSLTRMPGYFSWDVCPPIKEILDCLAPSSPVREVAFMKGAQVAANTGIIENSIGYEIEHIKNSPCMFVTADADLAEQVIELRVLAMLRYSGLDHLIQSSDERNKRKTGQTANRLEWKGGGFLLPFGANSAGKLRSWSIKNLYFDEIEEFKKDLKKQGSPIDLARTRTAAYEDTRKIYYGSTPGIKQTSNIEPLFLYGDQRYFYIPCPHCKHEQILKFKAHRDDGSRYGIDYKTDEQGNLIEGSVCYECEKCAALFYDHDKAWFLGRGRWVPTAKSKDPAFRSYHLSSLYSNLQTWDECVKKWLKAWDVIADRMKDVEATKYFYNTVLGETWEMRGQAIKFESVISNRRTMYSSGEIPNKHAMIEAGSPVLIIVAAADVHSDRIDLQVTGYCKGSRSYSIEWKKLQGDTDDIVKGAPWVALREIIENKVYIADDGKKYRVALTLVDSGYKTSEVYDFCGQYSAGVYAIKGTDVISKAARHREFSEFKTKVNTDAYHINTMIYKDRMHSALRLEWDDQQELQPIGFPNYPQDYSDKFFRELTAESKKEKTSKETGQRIGFVWYCPPGVDNHAWDTSVYCLAALEIIALSVCTGYMGLEYRDWGLFWEYIDQNKLFYEQ